jgi:Insertion element 4 transposase N-terminal/Transposase DDE domain
MARTKAQLGTGARLSDYLGASLLARVYPAAMVNEILDQHGCNSQRIRSLPAVSGVYFCISLSLYPEVSYEQVFTVVSQGLSWMQGHDTQYRIAKSSVSEMRGKLGYAPLQTLMERACVPLADKKRHPDAFYRGLRLVAIDGSNLEVADEADNVKQFGYPGSRTGQAGYPQAQCAVLVECGSHAILAANLGAYRASEWSICQPLLSRLDKDMLCLADRGFNGYAHWAAARASGAHLLWRCANNRQLPVVKPLADGSCLSALYPAGTLSNKQRRASSAGIVVRVIDYALPHAEVGEPRYRLLTTLLDATAAPALELAALYHQRWEVEAVFDELKVHLLQRRRTLRSKTADLVRQEFYGWVLAHYAVRWLMHQAASEYRRRDRDLSFAANVQIVRIAQPQSGAFPPSAAQEAKALV